MPIVQPQAVSAQRNGIGKIFRQVTQRRQVAIPHGQPGQFRRSGTSRPLTELRGVADAGRQPGVIKSDGGVGVEQQTVLAGFVFLPQQCVDASQVVSDKFWDGARQIAVDQTFPDEYRAGIAGNQFGGVTHPTFGQHQTKKRDTFLYPHETVAAVPERRVVTVFAKVPGGRFDPVGIDAGNGTGEKPRGFHQFAGKHPISAGGKDRLTVTVRGFRFFRHFFLGQPGTGENGEPDAAGTEVIVGFGVAFAKVSDQPGEQRAMQTDVPSLG